MFISPTNVAAAAAGAYYKARETADKQEAVENARFIQGRVAETEQAKTSQEKVTRREEESRRQQQHGGQHQQGQPQKKPQEQRLPRRGYLA
ncbi:MAG: hypothetical protein AB7P76_00190 [Candidatus Melainabacteria bacterium]